MLRRPIITTALALLVFALASGCTSPNDNVEPLPAGELAPDFSLPDVNKNSASYGTDVSPRDFIGHGSAWYFGHST
ncbi:MAG TPA: hypothetical protein ENK23_07970 [Sorangium sp.]|nr:hypothetical protein [Sorangium sp.]